MPFNRGPSTEEEEAAAWAAVLAEHAMMRKRIAELEEELAAHQADKARIVDLEDALTFLRGALAAEESRYEKGRNR